MIYRVCLFCLIILFDSCISRLEDTLNIDEGAIIIDGFVSDRPGPYQVRLTRSVGTELNVLSSPTLRVKRVTMMDDLGNSEDFQEVIVDDYGKQIEYHSSEGGMRGQVGRKYTLKIELLDGTILQSAPEEMLPIGEVTEIRYQFESYKPLKGPTEYGFRVFMDSENAEGSENVRWRFNGIFMVETFPEFRTSNVGSCKGFPDPPPCSGYALQEDFTLKQVGPCTCCICWAKDSEPAPLLNDGAIKSSGRYRGLEVGYIPFDVWRFHFLKYMVRVEQMSLTNGAFEFWKIVKDQKKGATSLFQPSFGKIGTNFSSSNPNVKVAGYFYATSIKDKVVFISHEDAPFAVPQFDFAPDTLCRFADVCDAVWLNASRTKPPEWD